ncbi:serine/threonine protein kinase [Kribbella antibiotica]|uniref:Serine/threonine protein kinase n=1 Tax=Kribbella antibiotica TaxID=190195 RepID=A0A4R4ZVX7_9ACTN|nr:serine/threonine-protein kinase [Kribbella antibiotica]TDD62516.1 serine/threonine protein kinase [Kribbella antibiotica]
MSVTGGTPSIPAGEVPAGEVQEHIGPYRLIRRLGQGGMGVVYLAEGPQQQEVAVKVLRPHVAHDETARARLQREATTLQKVSHPGVAGILDHDLEADRPYLVTRFVPGRPLDEQVDDRGPLTPRRWLPLAGCLAESLQAIHLAGVIHRDLKPGNVMMLNGKPVMIDFGIAQAADDLRLTQTGLVIGTPGYLAPELIEGEMVSESADWWGWAATVTFAATGRRPFGKGPFEAVLHRVHTGQADLEGLDPRLKTLLSAALAPKKADRPTRAEIMTGLTRYAEGRDALPPRTAPVADPTVHMHPPTRQMTRVMPTEEPTTAAPVETGPTPTEVAGLVPPVIPPLSAFSPLADKVRDAAATRKATRAAAAAAAGTTSAGGPVAGPFGTPPMTHPATYSPAPVAAAPGAMPYQQPVAPYQPPSREVAPYKASSREVAPRPQPGQSVEPHRAPATGRRTAVVVGAMVGLTGLIALYPELGAVAAAVCFVIARTVDRGSTALMRRRQVRGRSGKSDGVVAVASSPVQLVTAGLITLVCLILPLVMGAVVGGIVTGITATAKSLTWQPLSAVGFAAAGATALFTAWWGPGGAALRRGSHITARNIFRPRWLATTMAVIFLAIGGYTFYEATQGAGSNWARNPAENVTYERPTLGDLRHAPLIRDIPIIGLN